MRCCCFAIRDRAGALSLRRILDQPAADPHVGLTAVAACAAFPCEALSNLAVLGNPALAIPLFGAGWMAMLIGVALVIARQFPRPEDHELSSLAADSIARGGPPRRGACSGAWERRTPKEFS
jgi:hypothetical protein